MPHQLCRRVWDQEDQGGGRGGRGGGGSLMAPALTCSREERAGGRGERLLGSGDALVPCPRAK